MFSKINTQIAERLDARRNGDKGFTLVELLVVVIIIGILAAIAIPVFLNQRESAWRSSVESDLRNAALAVESFAAENNGAVGGTGGLATNPDITAITTDGFDVEVSDGNTVGITVTGNAYTINGTNENLSESITYDSATGGLGDWTATP